MRICVKIDNYTQLYDAYGAVICDNNDMLIKVKDCGWNIVVQNVPTAKSVIEELLASGYSNLSAYAAYFLQYNMPAYASTDQEDSEREIDLFDLEL